MKDCVKLKLEESFAASNDKDPNLSSKLLEEAFALTDSPEEEREAALYVRTMLRRGRKRNDVCPSNILGNVKSAISLSYIAKTYFDKDAPWLMQRINGNMVNGKPAAFTTAELMTLANGLEDLGKRLLSASTGIHESI